MALSFPTSPTSGQVYAAPNGVSYTWNSTVGVWTASAAGSGGSVAAWVNFDGVTAAIRASGNVSSVTKNGTGDYTVNFTTALVDANYAAFVSAQEDTSGSVASGARPMIYRGGPYTASAVRVAYSSLAGPPLDPIQYLVSIIR
jgi:hypothetical protein